MPCSISGTDGEGDHRGEGWYPIPLDQCLNHPPFGEDALYLPFLGKSIGKLRALTGVCMPTLETLHLSLSGRTSAALGGPRCWGSRAGGDSGPGHLKPPLSSAPLLCPAISFDKGNWAIIIIPTLQREKWRKGINGRARPRTQTSWFLVQCSLLPTLPRRWWKGSVPASDGLAWRREAALGLEYLAR